jgi:competence protein ComEC
MSPPGDRADDGSEQPARPSEFRDLGVAGAVAVAVAAALGAWVAAPVPVVPALAGGLLGWWLRWPAVVVVAVGLLTSGAGARALAGLAPVEREPFAGRVQLVTDPRPAGPAGWRAEVRLPDGRRVRAVAHGAAGRALARAHAGLPLVVEGRLSPLSRRTAWTDSRHLVGTLVVERAEPGGPGSALTRVAEQVRGAVGAGASRVPGTLQPLYLGLLIGDDRLQPPSQQAAFRVAGMTHLLAVSGQNVAFVLLAAGPLLRRLSTWPRLGFVVVVLVVFAAVTRFEPSVLRATTTAGITAWSVALGRPTRGLHVLGLAVGALLVVDPLLVRSVGFQLSVAASAGILVVGPVIADAVPGPRWFREPLAVTTGAQLAVLPLLGLVFGPVSVASVPANLVVSWAAGFVMVWGLTVGLLAGALPEGAGVAVQQPVVLALWWIDAVARVAAGSGAVRLAAWAAGPFLVAVAWLRWSGGARGAVVAVMVAVLVVVGRAPVSSQPLPGARLCPGGGEGLTVLVLDAATTGSALIEGLLDRGALPLEVVVVVRGNRAAGATVSELRRVFPVGVVLVPTIHQVGGARRVEAAVTLPVAAGVLTVEPAGPDRLSVDGAC